MGSFLSYITIIFLCVFSTTALFAKNEETTRQEKLIINMHDVMELPGSFRTAQYSFKQEKLQAKATEPTRKGLDQLPISGSAQFSKSGLQTMINELQAKNLYIIDLRQEVHGFINNHAAGWYSDHGWVNVGMTQKEIDEEQDKRLKQLCKTGKATVYLGKNADKSEEIEVNSVMTEEKLVKQFYVNYKRFYVTDHLRPSDKDVEAFISFVKKLPKNAWLHFHCKGGKGRTTTFMSMYDMMKNATEVTYQDIIDRQWMIGGIDLEDPSEEDWKADHAIERAEFLREFYQYCIENPDQKVSWSKWISKRKK